MDSERNEPEDAKRRKTDDKSNDFGHAVADVLEDFFCFGRAKSHRDTAAHGPSDDADVVAA